MLIVRDSLEGDLNQTQQGLKVLHRALFYILKKLLCRMLWYVHEEDSCKRLRDT